MCFVNPNDLVCLNDLEIITVRLFIILMPLTLGYLGAKGYFNKILFPEGMKK